MPSRAQRPGRQVREPRREAARGTPRNEAMQNASQLFDPSRFVFGDRFVRKSVELPGLNILFNLMVPFVRVILGETNFEKRTVLPG